MQPRQVKPILVYFKTRGNAQVIRSVLFQANVDFDQIYVPHKGPLNHEIMDKYGLDPINLPYFIDDTLVIYGMFPIIKYICMKFGRPDLLGTSIQDSIHLTEIMLKQTRQKNEFLHLYFKGLKQVKQKNLGEAGILSLMTILAKKAQKDKSMQPIKQMFIKTKNFILGYLTVLDFVSYEKSFYVSNTIMCKIPQSALYVEYKNFFEETQFYKRNSQRLGIYRVFMPQYDELINQMLIKTWIGDPKFISNS